MGDITSIPRIRRDANFKKLSLDPADGPILARVDGMTSIEEIAELTGRDASSVQKLLDRLVEMGIVELREPPPRQAPKERPRSTSTRPPPARPSERPPPAAKPTAAQIEAELSEEGVELDLERRRKILDTFYALDDLTFYDLLDIEPDADKAAVRTAYFRLSKVFHPDTAYGKNLGKFKSKMEVVFKRLTEAYDVLGKKRTREEYDNYIRLRLRTRAAEASLDEGKKEAAAAARHIAEAAEPSDPAVAFPAPPEAPVPEPVASAKPSAPSIPPPPPEPEIPAEPELERRMSEEARERKRQLMARKLAAATGRHMPGAPRAAAPSKPPPREATPETRKQALRGLASSLKETATFTGGVDLAQRYLEEAKRLEEAGNLVQAANALRLAVALAPDRRDVHEQHDRVARLVARDLADDYAKQAEYEEQNEKWADAALSWARVCEGRPHDGQAHLRAAKCLFQLGKDLQKAKSFAQRAVELLPDEAESHKQLGLVYHAAGMKLNARRALELAIELDPKDEMVENLLRELSK